MIHASRDKLADELRDLERYIEELNAESHLIVARDLKTGWYALFCEDELFGGGSFNGVKALIRSFGAGLLVSPAPNP